MTADPPLIRLRHIEIRDFRGIDHLELDLPEDDDQRAGALVLAGDNGSGKTSVLEAILLLLGRVDLLPADTAPPHELVRQGAVGFSIRGRFSWGPTDREFTLDLEKVDALYRRLTDERSSAFGGDWSRKDIADAISLFGWDSAFLRNDYMVESFSSRREPVDLGAPLAQARGARPYVREESRFLELKWRLANVFAQSGREETFARIGDFMRPFLGERWDLDVIFRSSELGSEPLVVVRDGPLPIGPRGVVRTLDAIRARAARGDVAPRVIPIDRLSSGQMSVLAMTYPFVFGDRPVDLALIDEPEQHLHPSWQHAFLGALRRLSPSTQFIVATHSAQVLDSVASYERRELLSDDDPRVKRVADAAE